MKSPRVSATDESLLKLAQEVDQHLSVIRQRLREPLETEFARGELIGWRSTLHTLYRERAEDIVDRVVARTRLSIPDGEVACEVMRR